MFDGFTFSIYKCYKKLIQMFFDSGCSLESILDPEGGSQNAILVVLVIVVISSLKIRKASLICSATKLCIHNYTFVLIFPTDLLSQIFHLFPN